ncbi:hypothetical protein [Bradyrhizobium sp. USDA 3315]
MLTSFPNSGALKQLRAETEWFIGGKQDRSLSCMNGGALLQRNAQALDDPNT